MREILIAPGKPKPEQNSYVSSTPNDIYSMKAEIIFRKKVHQHSISGNLFSLKPQKETLCNQWDQQKWFTVLGEPLENSETSAEWMKRKDTVLKLSVNLKLELETEQYRFIASQSWRA